METNEYLPLNSIATKRQIGWLEVALILSLVMLVAQLYPGLTRIWREWPRAECQTPGHVTLETPQGGHWNARYLVYLPEKYSPQQRWPLLLFLHGSGDRGNDLGRIATSGPLSLTSKGKHLPLIVVLPQCPAKEMWNTHQLLALLDHIEKKFSVDADRVYACGYSMGGYGTWQLIAAAPERFAAAVPVSGKGHVSEASKLIHLPIWAFHGDRDNIVPPEGSVKIVEAIRAAGGNPRLTIYEDRGHDTCNLTFSREVLYEWLLQQRRQSK